MSAPPSVAPAAIVPLQTPTPTPGVGVGEIFDVWPLLIRGFWFLAGVLTVTIVGFLVVVPILTRAIRHRNPKNGTMQQALSRYLRLLVVTLGVLFGMVLAGYGRVLGDSAIVVAAVTLALGVAGQTVIGSFVSGLVLVGDPEFNVGDYIQWSEREGTVQSITLRVTRVLTPNGELITVPNTVLTEQEVTRPYGRGRFRVVDRLDLAFDADVNAAIRCIETAIDEVDRISDAPSPRVYVENFGADTVTVAAHYWVENPKHGDVIGVQSTFARVVRDRLTDADIDVSPPSTHELEGRITVDRGEDVGPDDG